MSEQNDDKPDKNKDMCEGYFKLDGAREVCFLYWLEERYNFTYMEFKVMYTIMRLHAFSKLFKEFYSVKTHRQTLAEDFILDVSPTILAKTVRGSYSGFYRAFTKLEKIGIIEKRKHKINNQIERYLNPDKLQAEWELCKAQRNSEAVWYKDKKKFDNVDTLNRYYKILRYKERNETKNPTFIRKSRKPKTEKVVDTPVIEKETKVN